MKLSDERIEELVEFLSEMGTSIIWQDSDETGDILAALRELAELRAQNKWVDVSPDAIPKADKVQVWGTWRKRDKPEVVAAYVFPARRGRKGCVFGPVNEGVFPKRVTHWRELPSSPEEE